MDREKALDIMGLSENATENDILNRYNMLFRKFKHSSKDEKGRNIEDVEAAYRVLMGLDFVDEEADRIRKRRQEHPNPILKLLRIDPEKASNFFYYNKWRILIGLLVAVGAVSFLASIINRVEPSLKLLFVGKVVLVEYQPLEQAIINELEGAEAVQVQVITLSEQLDAQAQMMSEQKLSVELMGGRNDIFILDLETYHRLAAMGAFQPLDDRLEELGIESYDKDKLDVRLDLDDGTKSEPKLYGVDVSNSPMLRDYGTMGETLIAAFGPSAENLENATLYMKKLIESVK